MATRILRSGQPRCSGAENDRATRSPPTTREAIIINPETKLQNQIIVALCKNGCVAWNHTVGQFYTKYGGVVNIGHHGEADIWGFRGGDGRAFFIEVKLPGEKPRQDQQQFLDAVRARGALAGCAHDLREAIQIIESTV